MNDKQLHFIMIDDDCMALELLTKQISTLFPASDCKGFSDSKAFLSYIKKNPSPDIVIIDAFLDDDSEPAGLDLISAVKKISPDLAVFIRSWSDDKAVISKALKLGATDFIAKDADLQTLSAVFSAQISEIFSLNHKEDGRAIEAIGSTMKEIKARIPKILNSAINSVYVHGESGTGKEVVADLFRSFIPANVPFVRFNCATISPQLMMSELFGHEKGAFTGAVGSHVGLVESASGGWLFLDEIALLSLDAQAAFLRAIDNQVIRRVGGVKEIKVSFRIISATNESLAKKVADGTFRLDLWQRLCELELLLPPLRERKAEIGELIDHFCKKMRGGPYSLAPRVREVLTSYDWHKGNIRELRNTLRSMTEKSAHQILTPAAIPENIWNNFERGQFLDSASQALSLTWHVTQVPEYDFLSKKLLWELICRAFVKHGRMSSRALAKEIGIPKSTLPAKLQGLINSGIVSAEDLQKKVDYVDQKKEA